MFEVTQQNLHLILPGKVSWLAEYLIDDKGISLEEALKRIYNSKVYKKLSSERTKYWHLGPVDLYNEMIAEEEKKSPKKEKSKEKTVRDYCVLAPGTWQSGERRHGSRPRQQEAAVALRYELPGDKVNAKSFKKNNKKASLLVEKQLYLPTKSSIWIATFNLLKQKNHKQRKL